VRGGTFIDWWILCRRCRVRSRRRSPVVGNPCLAKGTRRVVNVKDELTGVERKATVDGGDIGSFEACDRVVQLVLAKDAYVRFSSFLSLFFLLLLSFSLPSFFSSFLPSSSLPLSSLLPSSLSLLCSSFSKQNLCTDTHAHTEYVNSNHAPSTASTNPPSSPTSMTASFASCPLLPHNGIHHCQHRMPSLRRPR